MKGGAGQRGPRLGIVLWMLVAVAAVASLAYWDERREAEAALREFSEEQATLAQALSRALAERLAVVERDALDAARTLPDVGERDAAGEVHVAIVPANAETHEPPNPRLFRFELRGREPLHATASVSMIRLLSSIRALEHPGALRVLVRPPGGHPWMAAVDASTVGASSIDAAASSDARSVRLSRSEAADLGLPARMAIAGLARIDAGTLGPWTVAVVTTARVERDRETRAEWRLLVAVAVAGGLVLAFGSAALRRQAKELELSHALAIAALEKKRDDRLVNADKLATMGAFATGIAHEVATPLGVIVARAEQVVAGTAGDERTRKAAEVIVAQADRIHIVIRGFLALARGHTPRLEESRPEALARAALGLVEHRFAKAGVTLTSDVDAALDVVACDPRMFEQVLVNLLLNACEACTRGGEVALRVRGDGDRIAFIVEDDGVGIDVDVAARATEPFFTTKPEGSGLGLAITNEIVHHHRGTLRLEPRLTGGTKATVELPTAGAAVGVTHAVS
jgi:two-component system NtrC family sensor kinase